jgi:mRNA interferase HigB
LAGWYKVVKSATWTTFQEVRGTFPSADQVGRLVVFNVSSYRLIARIWYEKGKLFIRAVLTHQEYDSDKWKDDPWF